MLFATYTNLISATGTTQINFSKNKTFRDIKPENFLLYKENDDSHVKLIDFGLAKKVSQNELMTTPNGTPYYIAPEVLKGSYTTQCDNWSMGVVMFIMLSGKPPFGGKNNNEILNNVMKGSYDFNAP
jgi:calcium-dependent protein kinase